MKINKRIKNKQNENNLNENKKRIEIFFNRIINLCLNNYPFQILQFINELQIKMNENYYLINLNQHQNDNNKSGNNNNNIDKNSENNNMSNTYEVNWNLIFNDIQSNLDILKVEGMKIEKIQEKIYQEINYEIERQNLVTKNSIKNPSIKSNIHKLLVRTF